MRRFSADESPEDASAMLNILRAILAPKERRTLATGGAQTAKRSQRNPWFAQFPLISPRRGDG
ncbi:MAG: hypothetical protein KDA33_01780, partial [Phycisphaerales bacterium]|nr:hypothetical protein [Phycisphaerales bacterium]